MVPMSERETYRYWESFIGAAVRSDDHTVELVEGDPHGINVAVDGVEMFDGSGYSEETFTVAAGEYEKYLGDEAAEKVREVYQDERGGDDAGR